MSLRIVSVLAAAGVAASVAQAQSFTPGNLVVSIVDLTPGANSFGRAVSLQQFDLTSTLAATANGSRLFALPASPNQTTTVANSLVMTGNSTTEGYLTLSQDRSTIGMMGYNTWIGRGGNTGFATGSVATTLNFTGNSGTGAAANVSRIAAAVPANYSSTTYTLLDDAYSGSNARSAQPLSGGGFLLGGTALTNNASNRGTGGARINTSGSTTTRLTGAQSPDILVPSLVNTRQVALDWSGNNVIIATQQNSAGILPGLYQVISGNAVLLPGFAAPSVGSWGPNDFAYMGDNTIYVADDGSAGNTTLGQWGGLQRWDFNGTQWNLSYVINQVNTGGTSPVFAGLRSITVVSDGSQNIIYGIDTAQRLVGVVDAGAGSVMTQLAASSATLVFRGVEMTPGTVIPTPGVLALVGMGGLAAARRRRR